MNLLVFLVSWWGVKALNGNLCVCLIFHLRLKNLITHSPINYHLLVI